MGLLSWLFRGTPPIRRSIVDGRQLFDGGVWKLALPMDWTLKPGSGTALYFESGDGAKGLYLTVLHLPSLGKAEVPGTAKQLHEMSRRGFDELKDYQWSVLEDDIRASESGTVGILDAYDSQKFYRICTKVVVAPPYAVRASFHDYDCADRSASRTYIDSIFQSLEVGRAPARS
jgi:hypothetical protein